MHKLMSTMRLNLKIALCLLTIGTFFTTISYWSRCGESGLDSGNHLLRKSAASLAVFSRGASSAVHPIRYNINAKDEMYHLENDGKSQTDALVVSVANHDDDDSNTEEIDCLINNEYTVPCRRDTQEVYVPFTFLRKYFEVYGKLVTGASGSSKEPRTRFEWQHSYSKYYVPHGKYDPRGVFMNFMNFNVEARDRVKCINAMDGVPVSMQWDVRGYLYPIQIAQFGLSHFSKNLTEPEPRIVVYEDGGGREGKWTPVVGKDLDEDEYPVERNREEGARTMVKRTWQEDVASMVMSFESQDGLLLRLDQVLDMVLSIDLKLEANSSLTVDVEDRDHKQPYRLHYVLSDTSVWTDDTNIYYGIGPSPGKWNRLTRDLLVDVRKGLQSTAALIRGSVFGQKSRQKLPTKLKILTLTVNGHGSLDNITMSSSAHLRHFYDAADWLVRNQDDRGGWPIPVERRFGSGGMAALSPGWYSAMAQGQAMSVLTRAYHVTGEDRYNKAANAATGPFRVPSGSGGVAARFLDRYTWYEEYPTTPSSFVLNGFIYALIGLYDTRVACGDSGDHCKMVGRLYDEGMVALRALLPLFDSGATSIYDLRHFTVGLAPNLARWDYHSTHIGQLLLMATVDNAEILNVTAKRWIEYMKGKRAAHN